MRPVSVCALALVSVALVGCGGGGGGPAPATPAVDRQPGDGAYGATTPAAFEAGPTRALPAADERVILRWARLLSDGDVAGAARQFALPTIVQRAPGAAIRHLPSTAQVRAFNAALPCGVTLLRAAREGGQGEPGLLVGVLRLTPRAGATCGRRGAIARVGFSVDDGRITRWIRLADPGR